MRCSSSRTYAALNMRRTLAAGICLIHRLRSASYFFRMQPCMPGCQSDGLYTAVKKTRFAPQGPKNKEQHENKQKTRKAKMQRAKARLVAGGCSASTPLQLPLTARPGHLSALSSPKHQGPALHAPPAYFPPWRCRFGGPIPSRQPPDLPAQPPAICIFNWAERNPAQCHSFPPLILSNSFESGQTAKRSSASSCSAFFLILTASGLPACLRYNPLGDLRREERGFSSRCLAASR